MKKQYNTLALTKAKSTQIKPYKPLELVLIIDMSGSMSGTEDGISAGYKRLIRTKQLQGREISLTTILFDDEVAMVSQGVGLEHAKPLEYICRGATALYDPVGMAIDYIEEKKQSAINPHPKADVCMVIVTDGEENSSTLYNQQEINKKIDDRIADTSNGRWNFVLLTDLNIIAEYAGRDMAIEDKNTQNFISSRDGLPILFTTIDMGIDEVAEKGEITPAWKAQTDRLRVGGKMLGQIKQEALPFRKCLYALEQSIAVAEKLAHADGLGGQFHVAYGRCQRLYADMVAEYKDTKLSDENGILIRRYMKQKGAHLKYIKQYAAQVQLDKLLAESAEAFVSGDIGGVYTNLEKARACINWIDDKNFDVVAYRMMIDGQAKQLAGMAAPKKTRPVIAPHVDTSMKTEIDTEGIG